MAHTAAIEARKTRVYVCVLHLRQLERASVTRRSRSDDHVRGVLVKVLPATVVAHDCDITRLALGGLSLVDTMHLLGVLSSDPAVTAAGSEIHARTGGNPFLTCELARFLEAGGGLC